LWPIIGAARLCTAGADYAAPLLDAAPPPLPLARQPALWWAAALIVLVPFIAWWLGGTWSELRSAQKEQAALRRELSGLQHQVRLREAASQEHAQAMQRLKQLDAEVKKWESSGYAVGATEFTKLDFYLSVMSSAARTLSGSVQLERFSLNFKGQLGAEGGGISNEAIHLALGRFYQDTTRWNVTTEPLTIRGVEDGLLPYRFSLAAHGDSGLATSN
jgi:hypothetical protein